MPFKFCLRMSKYRHTNLILLQGSFAINKQECKHKINVEQNLKEIEIKEKSRNYIFYFKFNFSSDRGKGIILGVLFFNSDTNKNINVL